jgi:hypothetical protein
MKKYIITLTEEERKTLGDLTSKVIIDRILASK